MSWQNEFFLKKKQNTKPKENPFESLAEIAFYEKRSLLENPSAKIGSLGHGCFDFHSQSAHTSHGDFSVAHCSL